jgi:uncharacterized membrane protein
MKNRRHSKSREPDKSLEASPPVARPEWVFAVLAVVSGMFMVFVTPPFQAPDESGHYYRAYQLSQGRIIAERQGDMVGGYLPACLENIAQDFCEIANHQERRVNKSAMWEYFTRPFEREPEKFTNFWNTAIYSPVQYLPQLVGVGLGRAMGGSVLMCLYAGRAANLLCWAAMVFAAIRITPVFKWVMVLTGLLPMSVFLAGSLSGDAVTSGLAMLLVATALDEGLSRKGPMGWQRKAWIAVLCVLVGLTKMIYFPLAAAVLLIPSERLGGWKAKAAFASLAIGAAMVADGLWVYAVRGLAVTTADAEPQKQISFVLSHPLAYASAIGATIRDGGWDFLRMFVGVLGWLDLMLPQWVYISYLAVLCAVALADKGQGRPLGHSERALLAAIWVGMALVIVTIQYVTSSSLMSPHVYGVQGRYFIPMAIPGLMILYTRKSAVSEKWISAAVMLFCLSVLARTGMSVIQRYYS